MQIIKHIYDDDYGCEEKNENEPVFVIVGLENENGETEEIRVPEDYLNKNSLTVGSPFPNA